MKTSIHHIAEYLKSDIHPITIALIGCGGTGSQLLTQLARIHVALRGLGKPGLFVTAYDHDDVSESNLSRQLFSPSDLGQNKAITLITRINRYFGLDWDAKPIKFSNIKSKKGEQQHNIYVSCVDTVKARSTIFDFLSKYAKPKNCLYSNHRDYQQPYYWLDTGNTKSTGQIVLGTIPHTIDQPKSKKFNTIPKLKNIFELHPDISKHENKKTQGPSCSVAQALNRQDLFINSILAQYGAEILWKMLKDGFLSYQGIYVNLDSHKTNPIPLSTYHYQDKDLI